MILHRRRKQFHEPSLVPLADMLTNTVGIMVFILIFTVLTAGGAVIAKRLPMEHATKKQSRTFLCCRNRVYPVPEELMDRFVKDTEEARKSAKGFRDYIDRFKALVVEDANVKLTGEFQETPFDLLMVCTAKEGGGESPAELAQPDSGFHRWLSKFDPTKQFVNFLVRPDSIEAFVAARDLAAGTQFGTGWSPQRADQPIRFTLTGGGRKPIEQ